MPGRLIHDYIDIQQIIVSFFLFNILYFNKGVLSLQKYIIDEVQVVRNCKSEILSLYVLVAAREVRSQDI